MPTVKVDENQTGIIEAPGKRLTENSALFASLPSCFTGPALEKYNDVQDELTLLTRARALDPEALAQIHDTYYVKIFRYIALRISDPETAEDMTSEVFTRLLSALRDRTAPQNTLQGWLFAVATKIVKDHYRKQYRRPQLPLDDSMPSPGDNPDQMVETRLTQEQLQAAMTELTEEQQNVIALRFGYEMSIGEVAQSIGKSEGSVKMLQARAIAALSRRLVTGGVS
jgi:RNA polymerase sigma-70 factor (ECF subfamily)